MELSQQSIFRKKPTPWHDMVARENLFAAEGPKKAAFNEAASDTAERCRKVYDQRGDEYQDTWALENQVTTMLDLVLKLLGHPEFNAAEKRLILAASLCDVKDSRLIGGFKEDSLVDGINYRLVLVRWILDYLSKGT